MSQVSYIQTIRRTPIFLPNLGGKVHLIVWKIRCVYRYVCVYIYIYIYSRVLWALSLEFSQTVYSDIHNHHRKSERFLSQFYKLLKETKSRNITTWRPEGSNLTEIYEDQKKPSVSEDGLGALGMEKPRPQSQFTLRLAVRPWERHSVSSSHVSL